MRIALATLTALALTFGAFALARGDEAAGDTDAAKALRALGAKVAALEAEVAYLRSREGALSGYVLQNDARGRGLATVVERSRAAGFEARALPVESRKILLDGLLSAATSIRSDLPRVSREEAQMLEEIAKRREAAGLGN